MTLYIKGFALALSVLITLPLAAEEDVLLYFYEPSLSLEHQETFSRMVNHANNRSDLPSLLPKNDWPFLHSARLCNRGGRGARRNGMANWISSWGLWHRSVSDANTFGLGL